MKNPLAFLFAFLLALPALAARAQEAEPAPAAVTQKVVVIPIHGQISKPVLYILRRGLKEAIEQEVGTVVLDIDTPGGSLDVTFDILQALDKFPGRTVAYVNSEAVSAGALISAGTDEIHFAPGGVIGAAAPVLATGGEIDETMKLKIISFLTAKVRSITEGRGYRGEVVTAMIDVDHEFKIGDEIIKPKGSLLSLTANEAMKEYGSPPQPLLGAGISDSVESLLDSIQGPGNWTASELEVTWSEKLAQYLNSITPLLLGIGLLLLFIEFKTPGFGFFGIAGGVLLAIVFFAQFTAGLSGHEPALFFALGVVLVLVELFFFPGSIAFAVAGVSLMLGSLVWAMADLWPDQPIAFSAEVFLGPLANVTIGVGLAAVIFLLMLRYLPGGGPWGGMVLEAAVRGEPTPAAASAESGTLIGRSAVAVTSLFPSGQVELDGRRYEARLVVGFADAGTPVIVTRQGEFSLEVEVAS